MISAIVTLYFLYLSDDLFGGTKSGSKSKTEDSSTAQEKLVDSNSAAPRNKPRGIQVLPTVSASLDGDGSSRVASRTAPKVALDPSEDLASRTAAREPFVALSKETKKKGLFDDDTDSDVGIKSSLKSSFVYILYQTLY